MHGLLWITLEHSILEFWAHRTARILLSKAAFDLRNVSPSRAAKTGARTKRATCGILLFIGIVITVDLQTIIRSQHWNVFLFLGVVVSILIFFLFNLPYGSFAGLVPQMYFVPQTLFTMYQSYVILLISVVASLAPEAILNYLKGMWRPSFTRILREKEIIEGAARR